jgi:hypothetical protein
MRQPSFDNFHSILFSISVLDTMFSTCNYDIKLDPATGKYLGSFKVTATKDFVSDGTNTHEISFKPIIDFNHPVWTGYSVHPIHVSKDILMHNITRYIDCILFNLFTYMQMPCWWRTDNFVKSSSLNDYFNINLKKKNVVIYLYDCLCIKLW